MNRLDRLALWPVPSHDPQPVERGAAILSSSGGVLFNYALEQRSVPAAVMVSMGNQAVVDFAAVMDVLVDDPRITAIRLFAEDIGDPVRFCDAAARALARGLPIVALKTGRTRRSAALAATHSGAMVAADDMVDALFRRCGVIRVRSLPELDETLKMLTIPSRPKGRRTAVLTISGGEKALTLDAAEGLALDFAEPSAAAVEALERQIPDYASVSNPFDFNPYYSGDDVLALDNPATLARCFETLLGDGYDVALFLVAMRRVEEGGARVRDDVYGLAADVFAEVCARLGVSGAVASVMPENLPFAARRRLAAGGAAPLMGLEDALRAVDAAIRWEERRARSAGRDLRLPADPGAAAARTLLDEAASKTALAAFGLTVPPARIAATSEEAAAAAEALGGPVVLKALDPVFAHKARQGGVALGLGSADAARQATQAMRARLAAGGHELRRVMVERMVEGARAEIILGVKHEPRFGHALIIGRGGVDAESLGRPDLLLLPAAPEEVARFATESAALDGHSDAARAAVAAAAQAIAAYCAENRERLVGLDVNPLIIDREDRATAVDALIELRA